LIRSVLIQYIDGMRQLVAFKAVYYLVLAVDQQVNTIVFN